MTKHTDSPIFVAYKTFLQSYLAFPREEQADVCALWAIGTHCFQSFDSFGYLVITATTKRAGKTVLAECLAMLSRDAKNGTSMTASVIRRLVSKGTTIFFDEAESLNSEAASAVREYLNVGYRAGQVAFMPGSGPDDVIEYPAYSPKAFILIGDVNDTLRDRSIVIELARGVAPKRYQRTLAERDANAIREQYATTLETLGESIEPYDAIYDALDGREAEVWLAILTLAHALAPSRLDVLVRYAVDLGALKQTTDKRRFSELRAEAERAAHDAGFSERALRDLASVMGSQRSIFVEDAIVRMKAIAIAPWRTFKGDGLTPVTLANLLSVHGVQPTYVKIGGKSKRGYQQASVLAGIKRMGGKL